MDRKKVIVLITVIVIVIVAVGVVLAGKSANESNGSSSDMSGMSNMDSNKSSGDSGNVADAQATKQVSIENYSFTPQVIKVKVGDTVTWTNKDSVRHDVTVDNGEGPMSNLLSQGESYTYTFKKTGTFTYHCTPHPYMKATVVVES